MKILILGATGLLGHSLFIKLSESPDLEVAGTIRYSNSKALFKENLQKNLLIEPDVLVIEKLRILLAKFKPDVVVNCISVRNRNSCNLKELFVNLSYFPNQLSFLADLYNFKLIHISSDAVFSGIKGNYKEDDIPDPIDDYGMAKFLAENISGNSLVLRTSIIGPDLFSKNGFFEWFLSQNQCSGYSGYIFSALPASYLSKIILNIILLDKNLSGLYHVGSEPISKFDLMLLIAEKFKKQIKIFPDDKIQLNRSLNCDKLNKSINFCSPNWSILIQEL